MSHELINLEKKAVEALTINAKRRFPFVFPSIGSKSPWFVLSSLRISAEEFSTGSEKYKYTLSLSLSLVACTVLVWLFSFSNFSGT